MANIDITGLFSDVLGSTQQQQTERELQRRDAEAQANLVGKLGGMAAYLAPQRSAALSSAAGGLLGLDTRTEADKLKEQLQSLGTPSTPEEHQRYADLLDKLRPGSGVQYMISVAQEQRAKAATEAETSRAASAASEAETARQGLAIEQQRADAFTEQQRTSASRLTFDKERAVADDAYRQANVYLENRNLTIQEERNQALAADRKARLDELSVADKKRIFEVSQGAERAAEEAITANSIAEGFLTLMPAAGVLGKLVEGWNDLLGDQDRTTAVRKSLDALNNRSILEGLPKGPASDKDIEMARKPFPTSTDNPEYLAQYLRGKAKLAAIKAEKEYAKAAYMQANDGLSVGFREHWEAITAKEGFMEDIAKKYEFEWLTPEVVAQREEEATAAAELDQEIRMREEAEAAAAVSSGIPQSVTRGAVY